MSTRIGPAQRRRSWRRATASLVLAIAAALVPAVNAVALPSGGASSDSAGTSSSVSARSVTVGSTLSFTVDGFPANHAISVKIADGQYCGSGVRYGSCVITRVTSDANGRASGSFVVPSDLTTGSYWLRFLTSSPAASNRGNSDFSVVAATSANGSGNADAARQGVQAEAPASVGDGSVVVLPSPDAADVAGTITDDELPIAGAAATETTEASARSSASTESQAVASDPIAAVIDRAGFPWLGAVALIASVVLVVGAVIAIVRRRPARAGQTQP